MRDWVKKVQKVSEYGIGHRNHQQSSAYLPCLFYSFLFIPSPFLPSLASSSMRFRLDANYENAVPSLIHTVCCIYHKPRPVGESSSESDDSTSSSSEPESDNDVDCRDPTGRAESHEQNAQDASQSPSNRSLNRGRTPSYTKRHAKRNGKRKPSPNAYEKMPKVKGQPRKTGM